MQEERGEFRRRAIWIRHLGCQCDGNTRNECQLAAATGRGVGARFCGKVRHTGEVQQMVQSGSEQQGLRRKAHFKQGAEAEESRRTNLQTLCEYIEERKKLIRSLFPKDTLEKRVYAGHCRNRAQNGQNLICHGKKQNSI